MRTGDPSGLWTVFETSYEFIILQNPKDFFKKLSSASIKQHKFKRKKGILLYTSQS